MTRFKRGDRVRRLKRPECYGTVLKHEHTLVWVRWDEPVRLTVGRMSEISITPYDLLGKLYFVPKKIKLKHEF